MSRNSLILERAVSEKTCPAHPGAMLKTAPRSGEYVNLVHSVFPTHSILAVIDSGLGTRGPEACRGIAAELAATGRRVVIVQVNALLRMNEFPEATACLPGRVPNVSLWPSTSDAPVEFFQSSAPALSASGNWLSALQHHFDSVLLECPSIEIAAMAHAAVLVVEAGRTTKEQIQRDQQALQLKSVKLAGCILMKRR
jgi:hypothetical protein